MVKEIQKALYMVESKVNQLFDILGNEWIISSAGGTTGDAYVAEFEDKKLFLKRNSSPFLAVLSAEGIVPKLVWTRRLENGDVITAQQWLNGHVLTPHEMMDQQVSDLLGKIHQSKELLDMLTRLGKSPFGPEKILNKLNLLVPSVLQTHHLIRYAFKTLEKTIVPFPEHDFVVCHGDIHHNNFIRTDTNKLYLIDWDGAMIADPASDFGLLLYFYVPESDWEKWLRVYGVILDEKTHQRIYWYVCIQLIQTIYWLCNKQRTEQMEQAMKELQTILTKLDLTLR